MQIAKHKVPKQSNTFAFSIPHSHVPDWDRTQPDEEVYALPRRIITLKLPGEAHGKCGSRLLLSETASIIRFPVSARLVPHFPQQLLCGCGAFPRSSSHPRQPTAALLNLKMEYRRGWKNQPVGNEAHWTGTVTRPFKILWWWNLTLHSSPPPFLLEQKAQRHGSLALRPQTQPPRLQIVIKMCNPD